MKQLSIALLMSLFVCLNSNAGCDVSGNNPEAGINQKNELNDLKITSLKKSELKSDIPYNGVFLDGVKWKDKEGNHIVFYTATGLYDSRSEDPEDGVSAEIFAYHYVYGESLMTTKEVWTLHDHIFDCPLATILEFTDRPLYVTDLNSDGVAEVWLIYRGGCSGDIGPFGMTVVMHEGNKKYTMDGEVKVVLHNKKQIGGEYQFDGNFQNASGEIKKYAEKLWKEHCLYYDYSVENQ